jgi:hypothetical protein
MGLSDGERISGIFYAIDHIMDIVKDLKRSEDKYEYPKTLINHVKSLWHSFIGKNSNSSHWVLGSSTSQEVTHYSDSVWGLAAINYHTDGLLKDEKDSIIEKSKDFNAFDGFLDISGLLSSVNKIYASVYDIYAWSEQVVYYLRRYDDKFLKDNEELSKVISNIQGECFCLFKSIDVYARAYILNAICKMIYTNRYPYDPKHYDSFTRFLVKDCGHHDLNKLMQDGDLKTIAKIHASLYRAEKTKKLTIMMRVEAFMQIAGRGFHYEHKFNELISVIKPSKLDVIKLKMLFLQCKDDHDKEEKRSMENYREDQGSPLSIYGYDEK